MTIFRGIIGLLLVSALVFASGFAVFSHFNAHLLEAHDRVSALQADIKRLNERILEVSAHDGTTHSNEIIAFTAPDQLEAEIIFQTTILDVLESLDALPISFRSVPGSNIDPQESVGFEVELETGYVKAIDLLSRLQDHRPPIAVERLAIRHLPAGDIQDEETPVFVQLSAWSYWSAQSAEN